MAYTKGLEEANAYFLNESVKTETWKGFKPTEQKKALRQAQRELEAFQGLDAEDPSDTSKRRWDYAIFEHAVQILVFQSRQRVSGKSKVQSPLSKSAQKSGEDGSMIPVAQIARTYLGLNMIKLVRG